MRKNSESIYKYLFWGLLTIIIFVVVLFGLIKLGSVNKNNQITQEELVTENEINVEETQSVEKVRTQSAERNYYDIAKTYEERHDYEKALEYLKKSGSLAEQQELELVTILSSSIGDVVEFGTYEIDSDFTNGQEKIEWKIIDIQDGKLILMASHNIDCIKYNDTWSNVTWEESSIREWLNGQFLENAFNEYEIKSLETYEKTGDRVYILSKEEWEMYQMNEPATNTEYAISKGIYNENGVGWSWLRNSGIDQDHAMEVDCEGQVNEYGSFVDCDNEGVRPVVILGGNALYE